MFFVGFKYSIVQSITQMFFDNGMFLHCELCNCLDFGFFSLCVLNKERLPKLDSLILFVQCTLNLTNKY